MVEKKAIAKKAVAAKKEKSDGSAGSKQKARVTVRKRTVTVRVAVKPAAVKTAKASAEKKPGKPGLEQGQAEINIGMIGHVDHGKTSLVKALTGKWTDTHSEELKKGISIRVGYADQVFYKCPKCAGTESYTTKDKCFCGTKAEPLRKVSFVDAPGHETLMATMLSGAALMDGAVLVIAANEECPQPRTIEHLMALKVGRVEKIIVAQNKIDLVPRERAIEHYNQIKNFLKDYGYDAPIIPVSANFKTNIDALIKTIEEYIPTPERDPRKELRMYVARSFDINKPGTLPEELKGGVLGGSIKQGSIKQGEDIEIAPGTEGKKIYTKVESISSGKTLLKEGLPGGLLAISTGLDPGLTTNDKMRGQMVGKKGSLPEPTTIAELDIHSFERVIGESHSLKTGETVLLAVGTATIPGKVKSFNGKIALIDLRSAAVLEKGQRVAISTRDNNRWRLTEYGECR